MIRHPGCALRVRAKPVTWGNPARFDWALGGNYTSTQKRVILFSIYLAPLVRLYRTRTSSLEHFPTQVGDLPDPGW